MNVPAGFGLLREREERLGVLLDGRLGEAGREEGCGRVGKIEEADCDGKVLARVQVGWSDVVCGATKSCLPPGTTLKDLFSALTIHARVPNLLRQSLALLLVLTDQPLDLLAHYMIHDIFFQKSFKLL